MTQNKCNDGYYEYMVLSLNDKGSQVDPQELSEKLNKYGKEGWEIKVAYANQKGVNAIGLVFFTLNWTKDQNVIVLQRFVSNNSDKVKEKKNSRYEELLSSGAISLDEYNSLINKEE